MVPMWYAWCLLSIPYCSRSQLNLLQIDFILLLKYSWRKFTLKGVFVLRPVALYRSLIYIHMAPPQDSWPPSLGWSWWTVHSASSLGHLCGGSPARDGQGTCTLVAPTATGFSWYLFLSFTSFLAKKYVHGVQNSNKNTRMSS